MVSTTETLLIQVAKMKNYFNDIAKVSSKKYHGVIESRNFSGEKKYIIIFENRKDQDDRKAFGSGKGLFAFDSQMKAIEALPVEFHGNYK